MLACDFIYRFVTSIFFSIILIPDFDIDLIVNEEDEEKRKSRQCYSNYMYDYVHCYLIIFLLTPSIGEVFCPSRAR